MKSSIKARISLYEHLPIERSKGLRTTSKQFFFHLQTIQFGITGPKEVGLISSVFDGVSFQRYELLMKRSS